MNLLYIDRPLVINPALAEKIGLNEAIILQQLNYWLTRTDSGVSYDGAQWVYNTYAEWKEQVPFFSERTIQRIILNLENLGLVESCMFNKSKGDRTKYYTINQKHKLLKPTKTAANPIVPMCRDHSAKVAPSSCQSGTLSTETTTENNTLGSQQVAQSAKADIVSELFAHWCEVMNKNPNSSKLTPKRRKAIKARLDDGYSIDDIRKAILGCSQDKFSMGENDRKKPFNDIELICRTGDKLESFRDSYRPVKQQKQLQSQPEQSTKLDSLSAEEQEKERQAAQALIDQLGAL